MNYKKIKNTQNNNFPYTEGFSLPLGGKYSTQMVFRNQKINK